MDIVRESKNPRHHECGNCRDANRKCFSYMSSITVGVSAHPEAGRYTLSGTEDIPEFAAWYQKYRGINFTNDYALFVDAGICPGPMITPLSMQLYKLYQDCQASGNTRLVPGGLFDQPAFFLRAMEIISAEEAQIRAERRGNDG